VESRSTWGTPFAMGGKMSNEVEHLKRQFDRARLSAIAQREGLDTAPGRIQCPHRCSEEKRGCSVTDTGNGAMWHCKRCEQGGSVIDLVIATRNFLFEEACKHLEQELGHLPPPAPPKPAIDVPAIWRLLAPTDESGIEYLRSRSLDRAVERGHVRFNVGGLGHDPRCKTACIHCWLDEKAKQGMRVAVPLYGVAGGLCSFQLRSIAPGVPSGMAKMSLAGAQYPPGGAAFGDVHKARDQDRLFLAEGMADTLALLVSGVRAIGAPGTTEVKKLLGFLGDVAGRVIVLCPQNDAQRIAEGKKITHPSEQAFAEIDDVLSAGGACVLTLRTPAPHKDPADWLKYDGRDQFRAALDTLQPPDDDHEQLVLPGGAGGAAPALNVLRMPGVDQRPVVINRPHEEHVTVAESVRALRNDETVFQRGGKLVHVSRDRSDTARTETVKRQADAPRIQVLPVAVLRTRLSAQARYLKVRKKDNQKSPDAPMDTVVRAVHALGTWEGIRALAGITECPVLRPDGSMLDVAGYDPETRLIFEPSMQFLPVPSHPTGEDVARAVTFLRDEVVCDFPWQKPAHLSAWVAGLLSPLARPAIAGPVPLFLTDSNTRGSGKSKLCDLVSIAVTGREMPRMPVAGNDEEWRKRMAAVALAGDPMVLLDNVVGRLGSQILDMALTGTAIVDRALGGLEMTNAALRAVWYASGNNVQLRGDLFRRTLHVRLESGHERPEERTDFRHSDLLGWAKRERAKLLQAGLTILRGYIAAGRPYQRLKAWGSFEEWSALVRGAIVWAGLADPYETREALAEVADGDTQILRRLVAAWHEDLGVDGYTLSEVCRRFEAADRLARAKGDAPKHPPLYDVLAELCPPQGSAFNVAKLGYSFRKFKGRVVDGKRFECNANNEAKVAKWCVASTGDGRSRGMFQSNLGSIN